jgi:NitT/TauT family transport system permease protein
VATVPPQPKRRALPLGRRGAWADLLVTAAVVGLFFAILALAREWHAAPPEPAEKMDLSPWLLPLYAFYSLSRGLIAYVLSLGFTLVYGYWAARDRIAERALIPLLDILQSIPVLGFLPIVVLVLVQLTPTRMAGRELAAILMIFTGQVWNMTFSFYHSLKSQPADQLEVARIYRFNWWQRFRWVELPFATVGLVWNSMMSMAGGWFFLMICESFTLGSESYRLPGLGSYMAEAVEQGNYPAMGYAITAMALMIILLDQFLWNPVTVWAQKFRTEEGGAQDQPKSWFLELLRRSRLLRLVGLWLHRREDEAEAPPPLEATQPMPPVSVAVDPGRIGHPSPSPWPRRLSLMLFLGLLAALLYGAVQLAGLLWQVPAEMWLQLVAAGFLTLGRVLAAVGIGTLIMIPAGLAIGLSPRWRQRLQPVVQVLASFPAPMLFPLVVVVLDVLGVSLNWGAIVLMLLGTQWYILFNVVAGAMAIPSDLREMARSYRLGLWQKTWALYLPAIFPFLVTGWVTAAGGAWNASIVAEFVSVKGVEMTPAMGLGAEISRAVSETTPTGETQANLPVLAAAILLMALMVVSFNRLVWRRCYELAATRFSLSK